ncbi:hypothetical protein [Tautonia rosea]|uniref:hypothetical protein n=1 Tax=Tautonia rosea TaxID=2728037 RepID=UPI00147536D8|nr:hypothetical protein [Tautonia rosea]
MRRSIVVGSMGIALMFGLTAGCGGRSTNIPEARPATPEELEQSNKEMEEMEKQFYGGGETTLLPPGQ